MGGPGEGYRAKGGREAEVLEEGSARGWVGGLAGEKRVRRERPSGTRCDAVERTLLEYIGRWSRSREDDGVALARPEVWMHCAVLSSLTPPARMSSFCLDERARLCGTGRTAICVDDYKIVRS